MFQVKTNSNGFNNSAKRLTAFISAAALSLFGIVASSTAVNAVAITKFSYANIQRTVTSNTFTLRANETLTANVNATKSSFVSDGSKIISSNHGITPSIPGVEYGQKSYQWTSVGCSPSMVNTATATPCATATEIQVFVMQDLTNTTGSPITITANLSSAKFTYGGVEISASQGNVSATQFVSGNDPMITTGLVITSDDHYVNGTIDACLADTLYSVGDTLTWESSASINGTVLADDWDITNAYMYFRNGGNPLTSFTVASGQMTNLYIQVTGGNLNEAPGTLSISLDLKNGSMSVLKACPTGGGGGPQAGLFPVGGASVNGEFSVDSKITVTANEWSLTTDGAPVSATSRFYWYVCDSELPASTTDFMDVSCFDSQPAQVLVDGTSVGFTNGPNQSFTGSSLTITQSLLTAMSGKHLMVIILGSTDIGDESDKFGELFMKSCGPISSGLTCLSTYGTPRVVDQPVVDQPTVTTPANTPAVVTPTVGSAAALAALPKSSTQPKLKFDSSSNGLSKSAKKSLKKVAKVAKTGYAVRVTGAAGMQPGVSKEVAKALAKKRAMEIRAYLIKQGVDKKNIIIKTKVYPIGKAAVTKVKVEVIK